jgi:uncharacterized protein YjbI with pentapeptide repeats
MESTTDRWTEIRETHHENPFVYQIMGGAALVALGILLGAAIFAQDEGYATNLYTEILSIGVTVFVLNTLAERREESRRISDLKAQLVRDAGSQSNEAALRAVNELDKRGWLKGENGLLRGADLKRANFECADLSSANLEKTSLNRANLQDTDLIKANLQNANLQYANLHKSRLMKSDLQSAQLKHANLHSANLIYANLKNSNLLGADLQDTFLIKTNLKNSDLSFANLCGARLDEVNMQNANIENTNFDESSILPDHTHWTPETDMTRFTNPNHPNFWRSDSPTSPAYHGYQDNDLDPQ